jgi:protein O-mannosyl-transferase
LTAARRCCCNGEIPSGAKKTFTKTRVGAKPGSSGWKLYAALAAIVLIAYSNSLGLGFAGDGGVVISDVRVQAATAENIGLILSKHYWWPNPADHLYRPLTTLTYLLNYSVLGSRSNPVGYHLVNLLLHLTNTWLVFAFAFLLLRTRIAAFCAAAIWTVHPVNTEAVTNVAGRADLLSAVAILSGLLLYARVRSTIGPARWMAAAGLFAVACAGVFSKENAAVLLGLLVLWDICFGASGSKGIRQRLPYYAATAVSLILMLFVRWRVFTGEPWPARDFLDNPLIGASFWAARFTAIKALGIQLWLLVFPLRLSSDRSYNAIPISHGRDVWVWLSLAVILTILTFAVIRYRKNDQVLFLCAGFLAITLLPTSNLTVLIGATAAERFLYLPSIGFAIAISALAFRLKDRRIVTALIAAIILLFAGRTWLRNADWNNDLTLATADVKVSPGSFRLHEMRARKLFAESPEGNIDEAIREGDAAWAILQPLPPVDSDQHTPARLGVYYRKKGDLAGSNSQAARLWYEKSLLILLIAREISRANEKAFDAAQLAHGLPLSFRLGDDALYFNLAATYAELDRFPEALEALRYERLLTPGLPDAYDAMARLHVHQGDFASAVVALDEESLASGTTPNTLSALQDVYSRVPNGECAFTRDAGGAAINPAMNPACPVVTQLRCRALSELKQVFADARKPDGAVHFAELAVKQGCPPAVNR